MSNLPNIQITNDLITVILTSAIVTSPFKKKIVTAIKKSKSSGKVTETKKINIAPKKIKR
jgi:hypothetical protein